MQPEVETVGTPVEHVAGELVDLQQRCSRCGAMVFDLRGPGAEAMVRRRGPDNPVRGLEAGSRWVLWRHPTDPPRAGLRGSRADVWDGPAAVPCDQVTHAP